MLRLSTLICQKIFIKCLLSGPIRTSERPSYCCRFWLIRTTRQQQKKLRANGAAYSCTQLKNKCEFYLKNPCQFGVTVWNMGFVSFCKSCNDISKSRKGFVDVFSLVQKCSLKIIYVIKNFSKRFQKEK